MLFVDAVDAVEAVLEMVLAIVWLPLNVLLWDSAPEGSVALPATTLRVSGISRWDEAAPRGVSAPRAAPRCAEALASPCAGYESYAEDSAEPLPRARPKSLIPPAAGTRARAKVSFCSPTLAIARGAAGC